MTDAMAKAKTYAEKQADRLAQNPNLTKKVEDYENTPTTALPAFILLGRRVGENAYMGYVEGSFSLSTSKDQTFVYWSSDKATSNFGGTFKVDGKAWAEKDLERLKQRPDEVWEMFSVEEPLPVALDWRRYHWGREWDPMTMSGVRDKYSARNVGFTMPA